MTAPAGVCLLAPVRGGRVDWPAAVVLDVYPRRLPPPAADPMPAAPVQLSARQKQIVAYLTAFQAEHGYPPTLQEIGAGVGLASQSSVRYQLEALAAKGVVVLPPARRARGLRLVRGGDA